MEFIEEFDTSLKLWADGENIAEALFNRNREDVFEFAETMALISRYHFQSKTHSNENFSFVANSSLSGGRHPCSSIECRTEKLRQLASFASLYADEVYVQNPFENVMLGGADALEDAARDELVHGIISHYYLRPLFEKGIIKYAQNSVSLCQHHKEKLAVPLSDEIEKKEAKLFKIIHDYLIDNCSITFDVGKGADPFIKILGPEDFIDHGEIYLHLFEPISDYFKSHQGKKLPYKFSKEEIVDEEILSLIINPILRDLSNQEWHSAFYGTSYLCDNPAQMKIASKINNAAYAASSLSFERGMQHILPAIYSQDMRAIVDLRERENEAFTVYRDKLNSMIRESKTWDEAEVSAIFRDQVLPQINIIDKKIKDWKSKSRESIKEKVIFGTGAVSMGLYAGLLPPAIGQIIAAIGGGSAVAGVLMDYNKTLKEKQEARTNDFFFLWQAKR